MTMAVAPIRPARASYAPQIVGLGSIAVCLLITEVVIRIGWLSRFIVPPPSEIAASFGRLFIEEHVVSPVLLHRRRMPDRRRDDHAMRRRHRRADAALSSAAASLRDLGRSVGVGPVRADVSAVHGDFRPQCLDHHHDGFRLGAAARHPQDYRRHFRHAPRADQCRGAASTSAVHSSSGRFCSRQRCRRSSSAFGSGWSSL